MDYIDYEPKKYKPVKTISVMDGEDKKQMDAKANYQKAVKQNRDEIKRLKAAIKKHKLLIKQAKLTYKIARSK